MKIMIYLSVLAIIVFLYIQNILFLLVTSNSMQPEIVKSDIIVTCKSEYSQNSIVTFRQRDRLVTHRLVDATSMVTKGDSNVERDPHRIYKDQIVGKVCAVIPSGKLIKIIQATITHLNREEVIR